MNWLFDNNGKSVASNAQRIVADMHQHLNKQNKKIIIMESVIQDFASLCAETLENDIKRLENRRKVLLNELALVDASISERKATLLETNENLRHSLSGKKEKHLDVSIVKKCPSDTGSNDEHLFHDANSDTILYSNAKFEDDGSLTLEDDFMEETEMLSTMREIDPELIFLLHRNSTDEVIVYKLSKDSENFLTCKKYKAFNEKNSEEDVTNFERMMAYGPKIIPNGSRDDATLKEIAIPTCLLQTDNGLATATAGKAGTALNTRTQGNLVGAIELPIAPNVIIDVWKSVGDKNLSWASTSVDGVKFAVLERIFVISEVRWGLPTIVQVDLFARHPILGRLLYESISITT